MPKPQIEELHRFYTAYGRAMSQWARIESELCQWFTQITKMTPATASAVFYSSRSFNGRSDMFEAAITTISLSEVESTFLKNVIKKAVCYYSFRNRIAHRRFIHLHDNERTPPEGTWLLVEGTDTFAAAGIQITDLDNASTNFAKLADAMQLAFMHCLYPERFPSLEICLEQVHALPNEPESAKPSRKQLGRLRQRQAARKKGSASV